MSLSERVLNPSASIRATARGPEGVVQLAAARVRLPPSPPAITLDLFRRIMPRTMSMEALPGGDLIREGLDDLAAGRESLAALLVAVGAPRLRRLGLQIPSL